MARVHDDRSGASTTWPDASRPMQPLYAGYFVLQALVGIALWVAYAASPTVRTWFGLVPAHAAVSGAFVLPDLALIVVGSLLGARAVATGTRSAVPITAFTAGAVLYPTLYLLAWVSTTSGTGTATLALMIPPALLTSWISYRVWCALR